MIRIWILILHIIFIVNSDEDKGIMWMKSAKCKVNPEFIYPNYTCLAKPYSRNLSTLTYYLMYRKPLTHLFVRTREHLIRFGLICCLQLHARLQFKYGVIYRDVLFFHHTDLCEQVANKGNIHPLVKQAIAFMRSEDPTNVHDCPYAVSL